MNLRRFAALLGLCAGGSVAAHCPAAAPGPTASGLLALDQANDRVFAANQDSGTVTAVDVNTLAKLWESPVGRHPRGVALGNDGSLWVACRDSDIVDVLESATGAPIDRIALDYGAAPVAAAPAPDGTAILVSCEGDGTLMRFDVATRSPAGSLPLGPSPRAIAVAEDGSRALVTRFVSSEHVGEVYDVSLADGMSLTRTISLTRDRSVDGEGSSRGVPNYLASIRIAPDGQWAWVVGKKDNTTRGAFFSADAPLQYDNTVRAQLMLIDLATGAEDKTRRLDLGSADSPSAIAFSPAGDQAFIALQGNDELAVIDVAGLAVHAHLETGRAPQAVAVDTETGRVFVNSFLDRALTVLDGDAAETVELVEIERLHDDVLRGKRIFHNASDGRMSGVGQVSCATCHIDGSHDGRTFDFTDRGEGFRNTVDLRGRSGTGHGNIHWTGNFDEIQDFENDMRNAFGGTGFLSDEQFASVSNTLGAPKAGLDVDLDALAAFVTSLGASTIPRSPHRNPDGSMTEAAERGAELFVAHYCTWCHFEPDYTDYLRHNMGTARASSGGRLGGPLDGIDTPTLLGVHATAPYLHDGSAATLEEVFKLTGGRLVQAEDGDLGGGAQAGDIPWMPDKEWHQGEFVSFESPGTVAFDIAVAEAGDGYLEIRYNSGGHASPITITVNGTPTNAVLPQTPNEPESTPNEWRRARVDVSFVAGNNTVVVEAGDDAETLLLDDIMFSTPDDTYTRPEDGTFIRAHILDFTAEELSQLVAYLNSLDGSDAPAPEAIVARDGKIIPPGSVDTIELPATKGATATATYVLGNEGAGPLNIGRFSVVADPPGSV